MAHVVEHLPATCVHHGCNHPPVAGTKRDFALCRWHLSHVKGIVPWPPGFQPVPDDEPYTPAPHPPKRPLMPTPPEPPKQPKRPSRRSSNNIGTYAVKAEQVEIKPVDKDVFENFYYPHLKQSGWTKLADAMAKHPGQAYEFPVDTFFDRSKMDWTRITARVRTNLTKQIKTRNPSLKLQIAHDNKQEVYVRAVEGEKK